MKTAVVASLFSCLIGVLAAPSGSYAVTAKELNAFRAIANGDVKLSQKDAQLVHGMLKAIHKRKDEPKKDDSKDDDSKKDGISGSSQATPDAEGGSGGNYENAISTLSGNIGDAIKKAVEAATKGGDVEEAVDGITKDLTKSTLGVVGDLVNNVVGNLAGPKGMKRDTQQTEGLLKPVGDLTSGVPLVGSTLGGVVGGLDGLLTGLTGKLGGTLGGVTNTVGGIAKGVPGVGGALGGVTDGLSGAVNGVTGAVSSGDLGGAVGGLGDAVSGVTGTVGDAVKGVPGVGGALGGVTDTLNGAVDSATGALGGVTDTVGGAVNGVTGAVNGVTKALPVKRFTSSVQFDQSKLAEMGVNVKFAETMNAFGNVVQRNSDGTYSLDQQKMKQEGITEEELKKQLTELLEQAMKPMDDKTAASEKRSASAIQFDQSKMAELGISQKYANEMMEMLGNIVQRNADGTFSLSQQKMKDVGIDQKYAEGLIDTIKSIIAKLPLGNTLAGPLGSVGGTVKGVTGKVPVIGAIVGGVLKRDVPVITTAKFVQEKPQAFNKMLTDMNLSEKEFFEIFSDRLAEIAEMNPEMDIEMPATGTEAPLEAGMGGNIDLEEMPMATPDATPDATPEATPKATPDAKPSMSASTAGGSPAGAAGAAAAA